MYQVVFKPRYSNPQTAPLPVWHGGGIFDNWQMAANERAERQSAGQDAHIVALQLVDAGPATTEHSAA